MGEFRPLSARILWELRTRPKRGSKGSGVRRRLLVEQLESRALLAADLELPLLATASDAQQANQSAAVALVAAAGEAEAVPGVVELGLSITSPSGTPLARLSPGEDFVLHVTAQDVRDEARGVFAAYLDLTWDPALAVVTGPIRTTANYPNVVSGDFTTPGMVDEAGASGNGVVPGPGRLQVLAIPMRALAAGRLVIASDPAEQSPLHDVLLHGLNQPVAHQNVVYGTVEAVIDGLPIESPVVVAPDEPTSTNPPPTTGADDDPSAAAVAIRLWITDGAGNAIDQVAPGEEFVLHAAAADLRSHAAGVFSAFIDVAWDGALAEVSGGLVYGPEFTNQRTGQASAGRLDEAGGVAGLAELGGGEMLLFSVPLRALAEGTLILSADAADVLPLHQVLVYRSNDPVTGDRIQFGTVVLQISAAASIQDAGALLESAATSEGDTAAAALLGLLDQSPASLAGADLATPLTGALDHRWALATAEVLSGTGAIGVTSTPSEESISDDEEPAEGASEEAEDAATIVPPLL